MYDVVTNSKAKDAFLQIRIREDIKQELAILADSRGLSMSALINTLVVRAIKEGKTEEPELFGRGRQGIRAAEVTLTPEKKHRPIPNVEYDLNAKFVRDDSGREAVEKNKRKRTG